MLKKFKIEITVNYYRFITALLVSQTIKEQRRIDLKKRFSIEDVSVVVTYVR